MIARCKAYNISFLQNDRKKEKKKKAKKDPRSFCRLKWRIMLPKFVGDGGILSILFAKRTKYKTLKFETLIFVIITEKFIKLLTEKQSSIWWKQIQFFCFSFPGILSLFFCHLHPTSMIESCSQAFRHFKRKLTWKINYNDK